MIATAKMLKILMQWVSPGRDGLPRGSSDHLDMEVFLASKIDFRDVAKYSTMHRTSQTPSKKSNQNSQQYQSF